MGDVLAKSVLFPACLLFCSTLKASPPVTASNDSTLRFPQSTIDLQLQSPAGCPNREAIESTLARLVTAPPATPLRVAARFTQENDRWVLFATLENGQRVIAGDSCVALAEALVVLMALAIDPKARLGAEAFQGLEQTNAVAPPMTTDSVVPAASSATISPSDGPQRIFEDAPEPSAPVPQRHYQDADRWGLSLLMLSELGALPEWSLGPSLVMRYGSFAVWGEVALSTLWPRFAAAEADPSKGGRIGWFGARLAACAGLGAGLPLAACAGFESGDIYGYGVNTDYTQVGYGFWSAFAAGAVYRQQLRHDWGFEARIGSAIPVSRPAFGLYGYGEVFQPSAMSLRAEVGLAWR